MQYKQFRDTGIELSCLGMGNMRFPTVDGKFSGKIDRGPSTEILRHAMAGGINYFDTAYVYHDGESEAFLGVAMKEWPRDSFYLATKYNCMAGDGHVNVFAEQLERLQTDYIDFYLIHGVGDGNIDKYLDCGCVDFFAQKKAEGAIKYLGFSFHGSPDCLKRMLAVRDWDFVQIELNYFDWLYGEEREQYEILSERGIPIVIMEPLRGGKLAALTPEAEAILKEAHPDWTIPSWGFRFLKSLPGIQVILSGMSAVEQMDGNLATFAEDAPFTESDRETLFKACEQFKSQITVPCTACNYCGPNCPVQIEIPTIMSLYNEYKAKPINGVPFIDRSGERGRFTECVGCRSCEQHCPQGIAIPDVMSELQAVFAKL